VLLAAAMAATAVAAAAACASALPHPSAPDAQRAATKWPAVQLTDLEEGRALYVRKCGGCHRLFTPTMFSPHKWEEAVEEMSDMAGLEPEQRQKLEAYLWALSDRDAATGG
jgi:cytochrome c5